MMKKSFIAMLAVVIGLMFGTVTFAEDPAPAAGTMTEKKEETKKEEKKNGETKTKMEKKETKKEKKK